MRGVGSAREGLPVRLTDQVFTEMTPEQRCDRREGSSLSSSAEREVTALSWGLAWVLRDVRNVAGPVVMGPLYAAGVN